MVQTSQGTKGKNRCGGKILYSYLHKNINVNSMSGWEKQMNIHTTNSLPLKYHVLLSENHFYKPLFTSIKRYFVAEDISSVFCLIF